MNIKIWHISTRPFVKFEIGGCGLKNPFAIFFSRKGGNFVFLSSIFVHRINQLANFETFYTNDHSMNQTQINPVYNIFGVIYKLINVSLFLWKEQQFFE